MNHLITSSIQRPRGVIALAIIITVAFLPGLLLLEFRTDGQALVPERDEQVQRDRQIRDRFNLHDLVIVLLQPRGSDAVEFEHSALHTTIFQHDVLTLIDELTEQLASLKGIESWAVRSLATEPSHRVHPGTLDFRPWLDPIPDTEAGLARLAEQIKTVGIYHGLLYAHDASAAAILVPVPSRESHTDAEDVIAARAELYALIQSVVAEQDHDHDILLTGAPVAEHQLGIHLLEDLGLPRALLGEGMTQKRIALLPEARAIDRLRHWVGQHIGLLPIVIVLIIGVFLLAFRTLLGAILPLTEVLAAFIVVFGLMGYLGVPIYLTTIVMPIILAAIGVADEVHIFDRYRHLVRKSAAGGGLSSFSNRPPLVDGPRPGHHDVLFVAMGQMRRPIFRTSITTTIGFLSFSLSPLAPVQSFGIFTAVGVIVCMLWSFTVIPAIMALSKPEALVGRHSQSPGVAMPGLSRSIRTLTVAVLRARIAVIVAAAIIVLLCPLGVQRVVVQDSWLDGFSPHSRFAHASRTFNNGFQGLHQLFVHVDFGHEMIEGEVGSDHLSHRQLRLESPGMAMPGLSPNDSFDPTDWRLIIEYTVHVANDESPIAETHRVATWVESVTRNDDAFVLHLPREQQSLHLRVRAADAPTITYQLFPAAMHQRDQLERLNDFTSLIRSMDEYRVGGALSAWEYIETTNLMATGLSETARIVPERRDRLNWLWQEFYRLQGEERVGQVVDPFASQTIVNVFLKDANYQDTAALLDHLHAYAAEELEPHGITIDFAGDVAVSQAMIGSIVLTQRQSLLISLIGILIAATIFSRSLWTGFLCILPCGLSVLGIFAVMGWMDVPLGIATSMFAGMTLGIGVDFAIHLLERFRQAREAGCDVEQAIAEATTTTGPAIMVDALALGVGFAVLMLSQVPANARLGFLLILSFAGCLLATMILLPALLRLLPPRHHSLEE